MVQRAGWLLLVLIPLAAVLGLLGGGIISDRTVRAGEGANSVALTYERWGRMHSSLDMKFQVNASDQTAQELNLTISYPFAKDIEVSGFTPEPDSTSLSVDGVVYTWQVEDWGSGLTVVMHYTSNKWRNLEGEFNVGAGSQNIASFYVSQFILP